MIHSSRGLRLDEILQPFGGTIYIFISCARPARGYTRVSIYIYMNTYLRLERVRGIMYLYTTDGAKDSLIPPRSDRFLVPRDPDGHI